MPRPPANPDPGTNPAANPAANPVRRAALSLRSGLRRYPRELWHSLRDHHPAAPHALAPFEIADLARHDLAVAWLGHASVLGHLAGVTLAVDPVLSPRIGPRLLRRTVGLARRAPLPATPHAIRGLELLLITHAHFDHLDRPTLRAMAHDRTLVVVPPGCASLIPPGYRAVHELRPDQPLNTNGLHISAIEPNHWGARFALDRHRRVNSYLVRSDAGSILFAGDTAHTHAFDQPAPPTPSPSPAIPAPIAPSPTNHAPPDLAVLGIGAYDPWEHMHATPEQAWSMFRASAARFLLPIHYETFNMSDEPAGEPIRRLRRAAGNHAARILEHPMGEIIPIPPHGPA